MSPWDTIAWQGYTFRLRRVEIQEFANGKKVEYCYYGWPPPPKVKVHKLVAFVDIWKPP